MSGYVDAWAIGVSLVLDDGISGQVANLGAQFETVQTAVDSINASLKLTPGLIGEVRASAAGLSASFTAAANAAERIQKAVSSGGGTGSYAGGGYPAAPGTPGGGSSNLPAIIPGLSSSQVGPEGWGHSGDTGYRGYVPLGAPPSTALVSSMTPNFTMPGGDNGDAYPPPPPPGSRQPQQPVSDGTHDFWTNLFLFGTGAELVKSAVTGAADVSATQARLAINQATGRQISQLTSEAQRAQSGSPISIQDVMGIGQDYYSVTGQIPNQKTLTGLVNDAITLQGEGVSDPVNELYAGIKSAEIAGKLNTKNSDGTMNTGPLMDYLNMAAQADIISQGRVDFNTALQIMTNAGPEGSRLSSHALGFSLLLAQQLGGSKTGVGIQAEGSEFLGGKMNAGVATILEGLKGPDGKSLLDKAKVQKMGMAGTWAQSGALVDQAEAIADPYQWTVDHLLPALAGESPADANATLAAIMRTQTRATGQRLIGDSINSGIQLERQYDRLQSTDNPTQAAATLEGQSLLTNLQTAGAGLGALNTALATAGQPQLIAGLKAFDGTLAAATNFVNQHPEVGQTVDVGVAGGMAYLGYQLLKGLKGIIDKYGAHVEKDVSFSDVEPVTPSEGGIPLTGIAGTSLLGVLTKLNAVLATLSLEGDTRAPDPGYHYVSGGFGRQAKNLPGQITGPDGSAAYPLHVVVKNTSPATTTMPSGPTSPPTSATLPNPGKVLAK